MKFTIMLFIFNLMPGIFSENKGEFFEKRKLSKSFVTISAKERGV